MQVIVGHWIEPRFELYSASGSGSNCLSDVVMACIVESLCRHGKGFNHVQGRMLMAYTAPLIGLFNVFAPFLLQSTRCLIK